MRAVVTGGTGFVGTNLCRKLAELGQPVVAIDPTAVKTPIEGVQHIAARAQELPRVDLVKALEGATHIFHLAADARIAPSRAPRNLPSYFSNNMVSLAAVLDVAATMVGLEKLVFAGSSSVYSSAEVSQDEAHASALKTPYALSKWCGERLCELFTAQIPMGVARFFNAYGPFEPYHGQDSDLSTVVAKFINAKLDDEPANVYGGSQMVDFTYIDDIVSGLLAIATHEPASDDEGPIFNLGTGRSVTVHELAELIGVRTETTAPRPFDVERKRAAVEKSERLLGWKARTTLEDGLARSEAWWRKQRAGTPTE